MNRRDVLKFGLAAALPAAVFAPMPAWAFPDRPIKLMVPFSAGGVNDVVGRQWADKMKDLLGTVYVENQGGATGTIATADVARAAPDGHTLILGSTSTMVLNPMTMPKVAYDPVKDFVPIALLAVSTTSIVVHASVPAKTLQEFIAYAKANSGKLSYGSAGTGTMSNLAGELFKQITGLKDLMHIPYKGAGPGITDLVSGHIPAMSPNITGQLLELHRAGKVRILAVNSAERLKAAPDIPTAIEQGVPGMIGLLGDRPVRTGCDPASRSSTRSPRPIARAMADPQFQAVFDKAGLEYVTDSNTEKTRRFLEEEAARWAPVVKSLNLKM